MDQADILLQEERQRVIDLSNQLEKNKMDQFNLPRDVQESLQTEAARADFEKQVNELKVLLEQEKRSSANILQDKQRLVDHLKMLSETSLDPVRKNSDQRKDDLKREKVILEALASKAANLESENIKINERMRIREQRCLDLEMQLMEKTAVINLFLTELENKIPITQEYLEKFNQKRSGLLTKSEEKNTIGLSDTC